MQTNTRLNAEDGTQVVVVTVNNISGYSLEEYANNLFNKWGIGSKEKDNGVLLLLVVDDRQMRTEVGYGLEGILTDGLTGRIADEYVIPYFKNNDFDVGVQEWFKEIVKVISENKLEYNITSYSTKIRKTTDSSSTYLSKLSMAIMFYNFFMGSGTYAYLKLSSNSKKTITRLKKELFLSITIFIVDLLLKLIFDYSIFSMILNYVTFWSRYISSKNVKRAVYREEEAIQEEASLEVAIQVAAFLAVAVRLAAEEAQEAFNKFEYFSNGKLVTL